MSSLRITAHAIAMYRARSGSEGSGLTNGQIGARLRRMARSPDALKKMAGGEIKIHGEWAMIQIENRVVTVYKSDARKAFRKKIPNPSRPSKKRSE